MKDLYIIGSGGLGRDVAWIVRRINEVSPTWNLVGFIDDNQALWGTEKDGYPILGGCDYLCNVSLERPVFTVCAIGNAKVRKRIVEKLDGRVPFATLIDPSAIVSDRTDFGEGLIVLAGCILSVDLTFGKHVILNAGCTIGHDDVLHDFVTVYPGANISGNVDVGACSEVGTGTQIIQGKKIGSGSILGAGSVVIRDIPDRCTAVGCPAKPIKFSD